MFINIVKNAAALLKKNLNLAQLVFIFFIIVTLFSPTIAGVKLNIKIIPTILLWYALLCAFFAGLFFAFKKAVDYETDPPKTDNPYGLSPLYFAEFFQGIGCYIKKFLLAGIIVITLLFLVGFSFDYFISHYVTIPESLTKLTSSEIFLNEAKTMEFVNSLSPVDTVKIGKLSLLALAVLSFYGFITMLYPVILVCREENFFKSFLISVKYLFKNLPVTLALFFFFNIALSMASLVGLVAANNIILSIIAILLQCYFNVWYLLSLFVYYEKVK